MAKAAGPMTPIVEPGRNCWRIGRAIRAAAVIDAANYFHLIKGAFEQAERRILLIGWDFDIRTPLEPDDQGRGESLGHFMLRLAAAKPERDIAILKWSFGALKQWVRPRSALMLTRWAMTKSIRYRFDSAHPLGCSHHQKIAVIDEAMAVCGGIDLSSGRWDTREHKDPDPRRQSPDGKPYMPWHDVTMLLDGPVAADLAELGSDRWMVATGNRLVPAPGSGYYWPDELPPMFSDVDVAIARTRAAHKDVSEVREIEALYLDMIAAAQRFIYFENQYLTSAKVAAAIAERLKEADPPEFVLVMPRQADGWLEQKAMDAARVRLARAIGDVDHRGRFRIYVPVTDKGSDIYVHAKLSIVDDRLLRIGSSNLNNRSLGLDSECDVVIDCGLPANGHACGAIQALRESLIAEHLAVEQGAVAAALASHGSMIATIDALRGRGKTLELLSLEQPEGVDKLIADNELLDPESPDGFFEVTTKRSLWQNWREGAARLRRRTRRR